MLLTFGIIILLSILAIQSKKASLNKFDSENTLCLRGFLAIMIVLAHIAQHIDNMDFTPPNSIPWRILYEFRGCAKFVVAEFFFLSAFGLMVSYQKKGDGYLNGFLKKRSMRLFIPLIPVIIIFQTYKFFNGTINLNAILEGLSHGGTQNLCPNIWFVFSIFLFYIWFYLMAKILKNIRFIIGISIIAICLYSFVLYKLNWGEHWYLSNLGLASGMFLMHYEHKLRAIIHNNKLLMLLLTNIVGMALFIITHYNGVLLPFAYGLVPLLIYVIVCTLPKTRNSVLVLLGRYSYEIYISHGVLIVMFSFILNPWLFVIIVLLSVVPFSIAINRIALLMNKFINCAKVIYVK